MADQRKAPEQDGGAGGKLSYEPPAIEWQETLEVRPGLLAICDKLPGGGGPCDAVDGGFS